MTQEVFKKYRDTNINSFSYNAEESIVYYDNKNNFYYYFVQRNLRSGKKLSCLNQLLLSLKLLKYYSLFFFNKFGELTRFHNRFNYDFAFIKQYKSLLPVFSLRLQNEYKGKHKTKRKFMYPILLEREKSQIFELMLWIKRISLKYKYRFYFTRLSVIFFNFFYYFNTKYSKIEMLNKKIYSRQRGLKRLFITDFEQKIDSKSLLNYKKLLWKSTLNRLQTQYSNRINQYYYNLLSVNKSRINYVVSHSLNRQELTKRMRLLKIKDSKNAN